MPIDESLPAHLHTNPTDQQGIIDAFHRCVLAFDYEDAALLQSSVTQDVEIHFFGQVVKGIDALKTSVFDRVSKLITTHFLSNFRVDVASGKASCSAMAVHVRPGKGFGVAANDKYTSGGFYFCDVVKDDNGLWKICRWSFRIVWTEGDRSVMGTN